MSSTSINSQTTQLITFTTASPNRSDKNTKALKYSLRQLSKHREWTSTHWAYDFNNQNRHVLHIYITWIHSQHAHAYNAQPNSVGIFSGIATSTISSRFIDLKGSISHQDPTEAGTFYFPSVSLTEDNKILFEKQVQAAIGNMQLLNGQEIHILSEAKGWGIGTVTRDGEEAGFYVVLIAWSGLDGMHDVKRDSESIFNNMFAPLKEIATLGTETALYLSLPVHEKNTGGWCVVS